MYGVRGDCKTCYWLQQEGLLVLPPPKEEEPEDPPEEGELPKEGELFHAYTKQYGNRHWCSPFVCVIPKKEKKKMREISKAKATIGANEVCDEWTLWWDYFYFEVI